jgi:PAS domain S-box-containing protein
MAKTTLADRATGSIRHRAAFLTSALIAVSLIAVIAYTFFAIRESLLRAGESRAGATSVQLAGLVAAPLPARIAEVQRLVDSPQVRTMLTAPSPEARAAATAHLQPLLANAQQQQTLELWDTAGTRVMAIEMPPTGGSVKLATAPPKGVGILPYVVENGSVISEIVVPVNAEAAGAPRLGFLVSRRLATNTTNNEVINRLLGSGGRLMVGNQSGTVWTDITKQIAGPALDVSKPGTYRYHDTNGELRIAGVAHVANTPLALVVDFPQGLMVAPAWALLGQLALVGLVFTLIAMAVVWRLSARVTQPLNQLIDALGAVSGGDYSRRVQTGQTEVGRLAAAFNQMAEQIQRGRSDLEAQAQALLENDRRKAAMMNIALDCILTAESSGRISECNPAAEQVFDYDHQSLRRQNLGELLFRDFQPAMRLDEYLSANRVPLGKRVELQARRRNGERFPAEVSLTEIQAGGQPSFAVFVRDLSEQKAGEESMRRGIVLTEENRRVHEASRLKSEFLANMSHELRTPLNAIIGFAELLYDGQVTPDMPQFKEFVHDILTSGQHLLQLINDVLDLSKVEAGRLEFHPETTDLSRAIGDSIGVLRTLAAQKRLTITLDVDPAIGEVVVDRARLKQVLYNYLSNAIKFTPDGGRVAVIAAPEGADRFRVSVQDTGIGIGPADLQRLFIEFNQLEAGAAKKHQGTGLGLALTRRLIEAQGGTVGVESVPGKGSTFYAVLPREAALRSPLSGAHSIAPQRLAAPAAITGGAGDADAVLVVDDDPGSCRLMAASLSQLGYRSVCMNRAADALAFCEQQAPSAVVLDLQMPEMDGFTFLEHFRRLPACRDVPVMVWTVRDLMPADYDRLRAFAQGILAKGQSGSMSVVEELRRVTAEREP